MSGLYMYGSDVIAVESGMPGEPLLVGVGRTIDEAVGALACTPHGAHESEWRGIDWVYAGDCEYDRADVEELSEEEIGWNLEDADADAVAWVAEHLGVSPAEEVAS